MSTPAIHISGLIKSYDDVHALRGVDITIQEGEFFGLLGPNGAGKTTTLRLLVGLIFPTSGIARIFGRDCVEEGNIIRADIGYLPSEVFYYEKMRVMELLKYSASFYKKDCTARINELCEKMELDTSRKIDDLSYSFLFVAEIEQGEIE